MPPAAPDPGATGRRSGLPLSEVWVHDPFMLADRDRGTYHLYVSNNPDETGIPGVGVVAYRSPDLHSWDGPHLVFRPPEDGWAADGAWAPEVHPYRGAWYLCTTLHDEAHQHAAPPDVPWRTHRRGTVLARADTPDGPFRPLRTDRPHTPEAFMALDGTLWVEDGRPWLVYAHEWVQRLDGTMEAVELSPDLGGPVGDPVHLFRASQAPWLDDHIRPDADALPPYVTDGPQPYRSRTGELLMLWSTYQGPAGSQGYVQTQARSRSGRLAGPWEQGPPLVADHTGHGMAFRTFDGTLLLIAHRPMGSPDTRAVIFDLHDAGDRLEVAGRRTDLDGGT